MLTAALRATKLAQTFPRAFRRISASSKVMAQKTEAEAVAQLSQGQTWYNELGSKMVITSYDRETGVFSGTYKSPHAGEAEGTYILTGRKDPAGNTLGWTVNWQNSCTKSLQSVTTWSGQLQYEGLEYWVILTTWLLTSQTIPEDNWESTQVGFDYFTQNPPSEETKKKAKFRCRPSHPREA